MLFAARIHVSIPNSQAPDRKTGPVGIEILDVVVVATRSYAHLLILSPSTQLLLLSTHFPPLNSLPAISARKC